MNTIIKTVIDNREKEITNAYRQQIEERLMQWLDEREQDILLLAQDIALEPSPVSDGAHESLRALSEMKAGFYVVFVAATDGNVIMIPDEQVEKAINVSDRDYFQAALRGSTFISGYFKEKGDGNHVLAISAPIRAKDDQTVSAVVTGLIQDTRLMDIVGDVTVTRGNGTALLIAPNLQIVGVESEKGIQEYNFAFDMLSKRITGSSIYTDLGGLTVYGSYSWLSKLNMGLVFQLPATYVLQPFHTMQRILIIFALLMFCGFFFISWRISTRLLKPINILAEAAVQIANGHPHGKLELRTGTEIDLIGESFDAMSIMVKERERILRDMTVRDSMTGLYNHRQIEDYLTLELQKKRPRNGVVSFIMVDIDFFKKVNDTYGHQAGDTVLIGVARIIEKVARRGDIVGRYGGEEFAIIVDGDENMDVGAFCERLRTEIAEQPFEHEGQSISVTVSAGYARHNACASTAKNLVQAADMALYEAKHTGRNKVCSAAPCPIAGDPKHEPRQ